jgi:uncharacterized membrane protein
LARKFYIIDQLRTLYFKYNKFDGELIAVARDPRSKRSPYFLGGLNPLLSMGKDFVDTFKPYKSAYYVQKDLLQPLRGLGNIVRGVFNIIATPLIFLVNTVRYAAIAIQQRSFSLFTENMALGSIKAGGGLLDGVSSIIRGATQLISTPLTWLIRMPLRGAITAIKGKPTVSQNLEKRIDKLEVLIKKDGKTVEDTISIDKEMQSIRVKVVKANARGQEIGADPEKIAQRLDLCQKFTEKRLSTLGFLGAQLGVITSESYMYRPDDSEYARTNALSFLGLFKAKGTDVVEEPILDKRDSVIQRWNHVSDRSYM